VLKNVDIVGAALAANVAAKAAPTNVKKLWPTTYSGDRGVSIRPV